MNHLLSLLLIITFLITASSSAPARLQGRSFKVHEKRNVGAEFRDGEAAMGRAYRKFGIPVPESHTSNKVVTSDSKYKNLTDEAVATNGGTVASKIAAATEQEGDTSFLSPITIGGQSLNMNFDTGSSDLWVFNTQLRGSAARGGHTLFDPSKSETFNFLEGHSFEITYGDKSRAAGNVGTDTVNIGGAVVPEQAIELATEVTESFIRDSDSDGLVGLAFSSINAVQPQQQKTFFDNIQPTLELPVFSANLRHSEVGAYEFGRIDNTQFEGSLSFVPVDSSRGFWEFPSTSFAIGDGEVQSNPNASPAIADTGTTLMLVDLDVAEAYWNQIPGAGFDEEANAFIFPCEADLPDFRIALGEEYMATIPGALMSFSSASGRSGNCFGGMQSNRGQPIQIYGAIMFKSQFVVFDGGNQSLGFAPHK